MAASAINNFQGWGVKFQSGGVLTTNPIAPPTIPQVARGLAPISQQFDSTIKLLTQSIMTQQMNIAQLEQNVMNMQVINDPEETVEAATTITNNKRVTNLTIENTQNSQ